MPPFSSIPAAPQDSVFGSPIQTNALTGDPSRISGQPPLGEPPDPYSNDKQLIELFEKLKKESFENRWMWERDWLQENLYVGNRQWITYHPNRREWIDKRLQKWIPRPVTNKMAETLQAIRTNLAAIELTVKARPVGNDTQSVAAAEIADQMAPLIHEEHDMNQVMKESDYWMIVNGSTLLQISWDLDSRFNKTFIQKEQCAACMGVFSPREIKASEDMCPQCQGNQFIPAVNPEDGSKVGDWVSFGKGKTTALSPFEWAFPQDTIRFDELPYIIRLRWREKHWFESNMPELVGQIQWEKSSTDRSLQLFKSLSASNSGANLNATTLGTSGSNQQEGITEYELWLKPTPDFPEGLVLRVVGEKQPIVLRMPQETLPGPFPYKDIEGKPLFPFVYAQYEQMGGKLYGRSALAPLLQKQDQLNQLDSLTQLIVQRMANPIWIVPEGAGIDHFTGEPGLVMKWNPLAAGGNAAAKPDRVAGSEVPTSLTLMREQIIRDIEELSGAFDIIKGEKPTGIEAFSALQLLVERSQSRFTSVFQARGEMYRRWFGISLELERQFGPESRVWAVVGPNRGYTFQHFENAQLQGQINVQIEDGSNMPKTALGKRAAIEQASQLLLLDPSDPDQKYALLSTFGLSDLVPSLNIHVQAALQLQDAFEKWAVMPMGPSPLVVKPWYDPQVHWVERIKWLNGDKMRELLTINPDLEMVVTQHLMELQMFLGAMQAAQDPNAQQQTGGGGQAMNNSNTNSGSTEGAKPSQSKRESGPNQGNR